MKQGTDAAYRRALDWIHNIGRFGIKPGLQRIEALLSLLGNPHRRLKYIHIGGTNGKGSTAAMIAAVLQASGYRTALYTSPYILAFNNRMSVNGCDIDSSELVRLVEQVRPLAETIDKDDHLGPLTEFEVVTALAFTHFALRRPDIVVLEVGLGGRLDATNVVSPLVTMITNISLDHTGVLGDTVESVAREKAGIIKPGVPVITGTTDPSARQVIVAGCRERQADLFYALPAWEKPPSGVKSAWCTRREITAEGQRLDYAGFDRSFEELHIPLRGRYQVANTALALAGLEQLARCGFTFSEGDLRRGLSETIWPARLELLRRKPLLILDGAHNPAAMRELAASLPEHFKYRRLLLVLGAMADKDLAMFDFILPLADKVILSRPGISRAAEPEALAAFLKKRFWGMVHIEQKVGCALDKALTLADADDAVLVTGSFYTVSEARAYYLDLQSRTT